MPKLLISVNQFSHYMTIQTMCTPSSYSHLAPALLKDIFSLNLLLLLFFGTAAFLPSWFGFSLCLFFLKSAEWGCEGHTQSRSLKMCVSLHFLPFKRHLSSARLRHSLPGLLSSHSWTLGRERKHKSSNFCFERSTHLPTSAYLIYSPLIREWKHTSSNFSTECDPPYIQLFDIILYTSKDCM